MQQQSPEPIATLLYRLDAIEKEIASIKTQYQLIQTMAQSIAVMERDIIQMRSQLNLTESMHENDIKMQYTNNALQRIEVEVGKIKDSLVIMNTTMTTQDTASKQRDGEIKEGVSKLQLRILYGVLSTIGVALLTAFLTYVVNYFTHFIH